MSNGKFRLESLEPRLLLSGNGLLDSALALSIPQSDPFTVCDECQFEVQASLAELSVGTYRPETQLEDLFAQAKQPVFEQEPSEESDAPVLPLPNVPISDPPRVERDVIEIDTIGEPADLNAQDLDAELSATTL